MTRKVKFYCEIGKEFGYALANKYESPSCAYDEKAKSAMYGKEFDTVNELTQYIFKYFSKEVMQECYHKGWGDFSKQVPTLPVQFNAMDGCYILDCEDLDFVEDDIKILILDACKEKTYGSLDGEYYHHLTNIYVTKKGNLTTEKPRGKYGQSYYNCVRIGLVIYEEMEAESTE